MTTWLLLLALVAAAGLIGAVLLRHRATAARRAMMAPGPAPSGCPTCGFDHADEARACRDCGVHVATMDGHHDGSWRCAHHPGGSHGHLVAALLVGIALGLSTVPAGAQGPVIPLGAVTTVDTTNTEVKPGDAANSAVRTNCVAGCPAGVTSSSYGAAFPATGTAGGYTDGTNMQGAQVFDLDTGAGTQYVLGINLRLSSGGGSVEGGTATNPLRVDPTGTTPQPASQSGAWTAGRTWTLGSGTDSVAVVGITGAVALPTNAAQETGGNLATVKSNTDPLVTAGGGGYVRQDSTATIAKETGGNLATLVTNTTAIATSANQTTGNTSLASIDTKLTAPLATTESRVSTSTVSTVASSSLNTTLLTASAARRWWRICNASRSALLVKYGANAAPESYTLRLTPQGTPGACYEPGNMPVYIGQIDALWIAPAALDGYALVTDTQ